MSVVAFEAKLAGLESVPASLEALRAQLFACADQLDRAVVRLVADLQP